MKLTLPPLNGNLEDKYLVYACPPVYLSSILPKDVVVTNLKAAGHALGFDFFSNHLQDLNNDGDNTTHFIVTLQKKQLITLVEYDFNFHDDQNFSS